MSRRDKLLVKMRRSPQSVRFGEVEALLRHEGFVLFNRRGSHCTFHRADGRLLTIVRPHGKRETCHPDDIR
jgi:predicted RNA binding protein YcfA (HicA-like mRNA interferase family)